MDALGSIKRIIIFESFGAPHHLREISIEPTNPSLLISFLINIHLTFVIEISRWSRSILPQNSDLSTSCAGDISSRQPRPSNNKMRQLKTATSPAGQPVRSVELKPDTCGGGSCGTKVAPSELLPRARSPTFTVTSFSSDEL